MLEDLEPGVSTQVKRSRLKELKSLSRKMSRWKWRLESLPGCFRPELEVLRRQRQDMRQNLMIRDRELAALTEGLIPDQRGHIFADFPFVDTTTFHLTVEELTVDQLHEHNEILGTLSRYLYLCEAKYHKFCRAGFEFRQVDFNSLHSKQFFAVVEASKICVYMCVAPASCDCATHSCLAIWSS